MDEPKKKIKLENLPDLLTVREVAEVLRVPGRQALQERSSFVASWNARKRRITPVISFRFSVVRQKFVGCQSSGFEQ
jgi:hypothetical protein